MEGQKNNTDAPINDYAKKLKVCGHPIRLKLLYLIEGQEDPCVTKLWTCLGESQPVISQHLAILKENGVVNSHVKGNKRIYSISDGFIRKLIVGLSKEPTQNP